MAEFTEEGWAEVGGSVEFSKRSAEDAETGSDGRATAEFSGEVDLAGAVTVDLLQGPQR